MDWGLQNIINSRIFKACFKSSMMPVDNDPNLTLNLINVMFFKYSNLCLLDTCDGS